VGRGAGFFGDHVVEGMELVVSRRDGGEVLVDDLTRRALAGADGPRRLDHGHGASPKMRGTLKRPSSVAGAWASTSSRSSDGTGASSRSTFTSGSGWAVGGTWAMSRAAMSAA